MKKSVLMSAFIVLLVMSFVGCGAHKSTVNLADYPDYPLLSDEEYYPPGYIGYKYPVRPCTEEWLLADFSGNFQMHRAVQVPRSELRRMSTEELAQTALCYPMNVDMIAFDRMEWGFNSVYWQSNVLRALAKRSDAREVLLALQASGWGVGEEDVYEEWNLIVGPGTLLRADKFGGEGFGEGFPEQW